ncbi:uncharacterized protein LOC114326951 isoform X3 [Diabrotica virgifera virgifera]|uniref:Single domain-containing protein n=1 Tax=Diabrotica virgifera virgifera TaxID=50390 RepID=A0ABM5KWD9_DIAVI|nr:uncharacterized protein LOC114326951 isoform X3 [Diabrotica virgifera virgifera]
MKIYFILPIVAITFFEVQAWVGTLRSDPGTEHLGDCYTTAIGSMKLGESKQQEGHCVKLTCGANRLIHKAGCGSVGAEPPCVVTPVDLSKPYPDCCPGISCPDN